MGEGPLPPLLRPNWPSPAGIVGLTTQCGANHGVFGEWNFALHVGDDADRVLDNRRRLRQQLGGLPMQWLQQVHGTRVQRLPARGDRIFADAPRADALYTDRPGVALAVMTADCLPVLLCDERGREVAAVHAGWRGLAAGILNRVVEGFHAPPSRLMAWVGPAICAQHFEVGPEVREAFVGSAPLQAAQGSEVTAFRSSGRPGHYYCDLYALARLCLQGCGIEQVFGGQYCTYHQPQRFYSYRRQRECGRMATVIAVQ